ncbi:MAG: NAD(P)-dependent alcohol dehydrogenase, partial [Alphaproteobacteria bacterium]
RIHAASVTSTDTAFRSGTPFIARLAAGPRRPRIQTLGDSFAGVVEAAGKDVTRFAVGDRVFGAAGPKLGAHAEYISLSEDAAIETMSDGMSFTDGAAIADGGLTALPFLRDKGNIRTADKVLINGASGAIGTIAIQLAKHYGAEVTAVSSGTNAEMVRSLGADNVIDYNREDFTLGDDKYDIVFDAVGKSSFSAAKRVLKPRGRYLTTVLSLGGMLQVLRTSIFRGRRAIFAATGLRKPAAKIADLAFLRSLMEDGQLQPVIDRTYPFERFADAHAHVDTGHKKGNVVIAMEAVAA